MSWRDDFNDASLDSAKFGTAVAGDGAVAESGGTVNVTMGAADTNAALVYIKDALGVSTEKYSYTLRHKIDGTISGSQYLLRVVDGTPVCGAAATINPALRIHVEYSNGNGFRVVYFDTAGTAYYWNGTAWTTTSTFFTTANQAYWFDVHLIVKAGKFRISITSRGGTKSIVETLYVNFSSLKAYTTLYLCWGEPYTNAYYCTSIKTDFCIFSDATPIQAYYNGASSTAGSDYKIGRAISLDGGSSYFRDPTTTIALIGALTGETLVKDPWTILVGGTYYLFYAALITATSKWRIRYATSSDQETWTDQGYITTPGGGGAYDEKGHRFPVVTYSGGLWRMYVGGQNASDVITVGYFYNASLAALTNYASNPVISVGASGAWDDAGLLPVAITSSGATIYLHVTGLKASTSKWQGGLWTSIDWTTWVPDGSNPVVARDVSKQTTASNVTLGDISLTVGDSTIFANDDPIIIGDGSNVSTNRVLSKADGTHITLYHPAPTAFTAPTVWGYNAGSVCIEGLDTTNFPSDALGTSFQASALLLETTAWWSYSAGWVYDPAKTPPLPLGTGWEAASSENLKWIQGELILGSASISPSASPSVSLSISSSLSPSVSPSASPSNSPSLSPSASLSPSISPSGSPSISPSNSPSTSPSASMSPSISPSASPSISSSVSPSVSTSLSFSGSPSVSPSASPSISASMSVSRSPSVSPSPSPSVSPSVSPSNSPSLSPSASMSPSASPSIPPETDFFYGQEFMGAFPSVFPAGSSYAFPQDLMGGPIQNFPTEGLGTGPLGLYPLGGGDISNSYLFDTLYTTSKVMEFKGAA